MPGVTAGYGDEVIFADGTFIDGSTAELSADGPMRAPYVVYCQVRHALCPACTPRWSTSCCLLLQGGTHWTHWAVCLESAVQALSDAASVE